MKNLKILYWLLVMVGTVAFPLILLAYLRESSIGVVALSCAAFVFFVHCVNDLKDVFKRLKLAIKQAKGE